MWFQSPIVRVLAAATLLALTPAAASGQIATPVVTAVPGAASEIPFELFRGTRIVVEGQINGVRTPMLLDSGAGVTTIDSGFARRIGIKEGMKITAHGTGGRQSAELVQDVVIEVGTLKLSGVSAAVIDMDAIEKAIGRPIPVILGRELFMNSIVQLDFEKNVLALAPTEEFSAPAGATEITLTRDGTLHYLPMSINGSPAQAALDLGNGGVLGISKEYADGNPALEALPFAVAFGGGVGGLHELRRVTVPKIDIGGFTFTDVPADVGQRGGGPYAGGANAGIQLFKPFRVTFDLGHDRLWLERNKNSSVFPRDRAGLFAILEDDHLNVLHVAPNSPAAKAGLKVGDRIAAVGQLNVNSGFYSSVQAEWAKGTAGTQVALTTQDGRRAVVTLADYY